MTPIALIGLEYHLHPSCLADHLVWTGADGMLLETIVPYLLEVLLGDDDASGRGSGAVKGHEVGPGLFQVETHHQGVDDLDGADMRLQFLRPCPLIALEAELDILSSDGIAVVEFEPRPQREFVDQSIRALRPRLRQTVAHLLLRQGAHQRIVNGIEHPKRRNLWRSRGWIEPGGGEGHVPGDHHLPSRFRLRT